MEKVVDAATTVFLMALSVRFYRFFVGGFDWYGDAYVQWYLTKQLIHEGEWNHTFWLPFYNIVCGAFMILTGNETLLIPKLMVCLLLIGLTFRSILWNGWLHSHHNQIWYESEAGKWFKGTYDEGNIVCDSYAFIYHSETPINSIISVWNLEWFATAHNETQLEEWLYNNNVKYIIWTSYPAGWILKELEDGESDFSFIKRAYPETLQKHSKNPLYVYKVEL